jgi:hypothetical protein
MRARRELRRLSALGAVTVLGFAVPGCSKGATSDVEAYCAVLTARATEITARISTEAELTARLELYDELAAAAPLTVEDQWDALASAVRAASVVPLGDAEARAEVIAEMTSAERGAREIVAHAATACGVTIDGIVPPPAVVTPPTVPSAAATTTT